MNLVWWFVWDVLLFWIFFTPYKIPRQRNKKDSPLDVLKKRFSRGEIDNVEYEEKKKIIQLRPAFMRLSMLDEQCKLIYQIKN